MKLTAQSIDRMKPQDARQQISDDHCPGLNLIVQPSGKKSWAVRYRMNGTHRRMTLGSYPVLSLADARARTREVLAAASEGRDPAEEVRAEKTAKTDNDRDKLRILFDLYDKRHLSNLRSGGEQKRQLARYVLPKLGDRDVRTITRRDVLDLLEEIADTGRGVTANRVRTYFQTFLNWCIERDVIEVNPTARMKPVAKEKPRDRALGDDEIRWFWQACDAAGYPFGTLGQLLLLTGQRTGEVSRMTTAEIRGDLWHLSADRTKNGRAHDVPLSAPVRALIDKAPRLDGPAGYILSTTGTTRISGFSRAQASLAKRMQKIAEQERGEPVEIPHWTWHDLRRTAATGMARLGIPVRITEAVLNHVSGTGSGIVAVYQRHDYADEKRQALDAWARFVGSLVEGKADNVVRIGGRGE
ncbi:tyrosine-type recombinase/integrase [Paenirhodobacter enshiensis]|uniref:tyrosine-type recombinase/integrase n=1 Tax=Paenirhodobacter enshiensis TaxID=1105367 RepID=UPI0035AFD20E